jgi:hypothetical protein
MSYFNEAAIAQEIGDEQRFVASLFASWAHAPKTQ